MKSDQLRFIENLNTQVRSLPTLSQLVTEIGLGKTTKSIIEERLIQWDKALVKDSKFYRTQKGILSNSKNKGLTVKRYLDLALSFGLCNNINELVFNTDLGKVLVYLNKEKSLKNYYLQDSEVIFLTNLLINSDFDVIILALTILNKSHEISQKKILNIFSTELLNRLKNKQKHSSQSAKNNINEKFRKVKFEWEKPEIYAEHIVVPRLEWLSQINLIEKNSRSTRTTYQLTKNGINFLQKINYSPNEDFYEIDSVWINKNSQKAIVENCVQENTFTLWNELEKGEKTELFGYYIIEAYNLFSKGSALRVPIFPTLLLAVSNLFRKMNIVAEFEELKLLLKDSFSFDKRIFSIREAARTNEGYILIQF